MLMTYVMPDIVRVFTSRGADLPLLTRGLIVVSEALRAYGLAARRWRSALARARLAALAGGSGQSPALPPAAGARTAPPPASCTRVNSAQFSGTLATLVQSRVPLVEALAAAGAVTPRGVQWGVLDVANFPRLDGSWFAAPPSDHSCRFSTPSGVLRRSGGHGDGARPRRA